MISAVAPDLVKATKGAMPVPVPMKITGGAGGEGGGERTAWGLVSIIPGSRSMAEKKALGTELRPVEKGASENIKDVKESGCTLLILFNAEVHLL